MHALRKSCIDDWMRAGYDPATVQNWASHADLKTTLKYYTQAGPKNVKRANLVSSFAQSDATSDATGSE